MQVSKGQVGGLLTIEKQQVDCRWEQLLILQQLQEISFSSIDTIFYVWACFAPNLSRLLEFGGIFLDREHAEFIRVAALGVIACRECEIDGGDAKGSTTFDYTSGAIQAGD